MTQGDNDNLTIDRWRHFQLELKRLDPLGYYSNDISDYSAEAYELGLRGDVTVESLCYVLDITEAKAKTLWWELHPYAQRVI